MSNSVKFKISRNLPPVLKTVTCTVHIASSPGHSQILSRSRGEKSGEGLGAKLRHGPEMVDSVRDKIWEWPGDEATVHTA